MKRICIYLIFDKQNIIDRYIGYMLRELKTCVDHLVVICNMTGMIENRAILEKYADEIFQRDNIGYDAGGFKDALYCLMGWKKVLQYDELVLVNDSFFGPFRPMAGIFSEMDQKEVDFWGLLKHKERVVEETGAYIPEHIQSFFLVVRSRMLHNACFQEFWDGISYYDTFWQTVYGYELAFTKFFRDKGYTYATLADTLSLGDEEYIENNYNPYAFAAYELIVKGNFPFLKRSPLSLDLLGEKTQEGFRMALDHIEKNTEYKTDLIWENVIRTMNISDLYRNFHLRYLITEDEKSTIATVENTILVAVIVSNIKSQSMVVEYLSKIVDYCYVIVLAEKEYLLENYRKLHYDCRIYSEDMFQEIMRELSCGDYVCILHDVDLTSDTNPDYKGRSRFYGIWENLVKSLSYIKNVIRLFQQDERLGLLSAPLPFFSDYFGSIGRGWDGKYQRIKNMLGTWDIKCTISEVKPPFAYFENFWVRGDILKELPPVQKRDMDCLPYLWCYFAQAGGYYSGVVENTDFASMNETNLEWSLGKICEQASRQCGKIRKYADIHNIIFQCALAKYKKGYEKIYIYGAGEKARVYRPYILEILDSSDIAGYIISDDQVKSGALEGVKVFYFSEIELTDRVGIVVCTNTRNQAEITEILDYKGVKDYLCI